MPTDALPTSNAILGAIVVGKTYDLVLWIVQKVEKFPKSYRFSVGQRLIDTALDLLLLLVEPAYRREGQSFEGRALLTRRTRSYAQPGREPRYNSRRRVVMVWIVADREHLGGKPRVTGTRISIEFLLECLACGMTLPEIVEEYPTLSEEAIKGALEELAHSDRIAAP